MAFDFAAAVQAPFRVQPGLRRIAPERALLTPQRVGDAHTVVKREVLARRSAQALLAVDGFDAMPALHALCAAATAAHPDAFAWDGACARALWLGWAVEDDRPVALDGAEPAVGACLCALPAGWRLAGLLALAFAEDFAVLDAADGTVPWLAVCLPSHWAPENKVGRHFAEVHGPVADHALLLRASAHLIRLVTAGERWERFVWSVTSHGALDAHPQRLPRERWPTDGDAQALAAAAWWRTEQQSFIPVPGRPQAVFTILVELQPLTQAIGDAARARQLHDALATMSPAVLAYRNLDSARERLLEWLAVRTAQS
jgi:hypothetical protein